MTIKCRNCIWPLLGKILQHHHHCSHIEEGWYCNGLGVNVQVVSALCGVSCKGCHNGRGLWLCKRNKGVRYKWGSSDWCICRENICFRFYQRIFENMVSWPSAMDELRKGFCQNSCRGLRWWGEGFGFRHLSRRRCLKLWAIGGSWEEEHVDVSVNKDARDVDDSIFEFLYGLDQSDSRPGTSDGYSKEIQVGGGYVLVEGEVDVVRAGFEDIVAQLGGSVGVVKVVVGFFRIEDSVVWRRSGSGGRHEDDQECRGTRGYEWGCTPLGFLGLLLGRLMTAMSFWKRDSWSISRGIGDLSLISYVQWSLWLHTLLLLW